MNYWLMANTAAGDGSHDANFWRERLLAAGLDSLQVRDIVETDWHRQIEPGDRLLVAGGDGSVNSAAALCIERRAVLGVLPSGTANDFARNLGLPDDPVDVCRVALGAHTAKVDVAWINGQLYLNVAHIGLGTVPAREASPREKKLLGRFSYLVTLARKLGVQRGFHGRIEGDDQTVEGRWLTIAIASGAYFGGGHGIAGARIDDGQLDIVAVRQRAWFRLLLSYLSTRLLGHPPEGDDTVVHLRSPQCHVQLRHARTLTADGETMGRMANVSAFTRRAVLEVACQGVVGAHDSTLAGEIREAS
ncbi:diacylglycerol kinase family lipid kinase [Billgrantia tianxiuensis]|jgi:YegS/Rv2252/BmrU family lipid kinase|uniref:Diacylglycerol kinase family lipid kinase n=1 Tax=Billgrantia tianxiuensis TaxID=2497861 RepID=A0A6I6SRR3_9GAMM|nr:MULTISPECIES: diacylglycerol kinase family protein [Halomonas]MCE8033761.1 diacylglycerol kinase family lipid kinase [Halomonas sp. MCCC 1A11057]QHC51334.1 diacylglycerol kinase family lipid kinase [Halomonas tianxiuensis]